jgi:hypothetical protein
MTSIASAHSVRQRSGSSFSACFASMCSLSNVSCGPEVAVFVPLEDLSNLASLGGGAAALGGMFSSAFPPAGLFRFPPLRVAGLPTTAAVSGVPWGAARAVCIGVCADAASGVRAGVRAGVRVGVGAGVRAGVRRLLGLGIREGEANAIVLLVVRVGFRAGVEAAGRVIFSLSLDALGKLEGRTRAWVSVGVAGAASVSGG